MAYPIRKRKCPHCKTFFHPDYRNVTRQRFCAKPDCRQASKVDAQQRWRQKPENLDYFKGSEHVQRVRQWRLEHPGYWRRKTCDAQLFCPSAFSCRSTPWDALDLTRAQTLDGPRMRTDPAPPV